MLLLNNPSVKNQKIFDSSLCTREPYADDKRQIQLTAIRILCRIKGIIKTLSAESVFVV